MKIVCPGCTTEFNVDESRIPPHGASVRCPRCFKAVDVAPMSEEDQLMSQLGMTPGATDQAAKDTYAFGQTIVASAFPQQEDPVQAPKTIQSPPSAAGAEESPWAGAPAKAKAKPQPH